MHVDGMIFRLKELGDAMALPVYALSGRRPWSLGYYTTKKASIQAAIDAAAVQRGRPLPEGFGIGIDERVVEYPWLFDRLRHGDVRLGQILDAGSTLNHDYILNRDPLRKADLTIMTLAPEKRCFWHQGYSYVFGDFRKTRFGAAAFDTIISISTLEHVGLDNTMLYTDDPAKSETNKYGFVDAVREFRRILAPGGRCLITVPYGRNDNFDWFQLFDGDMIRTLINAFEATSFELEFFGYDRAGWRRASEADVTGATAFDPHSGRGRLDDKAGCARAIACLELFG
ncbi:methyltransferase domain-containing protein [Bradyrhizobium stylosanthis]|uniref:Methyltransferase family protein n=1 Tax=Bradyrhizobium stylosanthis TaxID=1803665 RepID=A0A560DY49_9BRAD|nr:methyltransferase domain-containing protein [Bradyrhizobium stylosanthis]TWB02024.1 methyltransferase family protein [Bradyrhizobium stylosanthis]